MRIAQPVAPLRLVDLPVDALAGEAPVVSIAFGGVYTPPGDHQEVADGPN